MSTDADSAPSTSTIVAVTATGSHILDIVGYSSTKLIPTGVDYFTSLSFHAGGYSWQIAYLPNGDSDENADYISLFLVLDDDPTAPVMADFTMSLVDHAGKPVPHHTKKSQICQFAGPGAYWGFARFIEREALETSQYLSDDCFSVSCDVTVTTEFHMEGGAGAAPAFVLVPPLDCLRHFRDLLMSGEGADVRFQVGGEDIAAHRCMLAARSPVFRAKFFGATEESAATAHCVVEVDDMRADVFRDLLHFIYTDSLPEPTEPKPDHEEEILMDQNLLIAADRYSMEKLKVICEDKLCRDIDVSTAATMLALAEQYGCHRLKEACFEFLRYWEVHDAVL